MPRKSLAPAFVVVKYNTTVGSIVLPHEMIIPVNVVTWAGDATVLTKKGGGTVAWATGVTAMLTPILALYHTTSAFHTFELWRQDTAASDPQLISTYASAAVGTSGGSTVQASGVCYAFRSTEDSAYRLLLIESNQLADQRKAYSTMSPTQQAVVTQLLGVDSIVYARSNAYLNTFGLFTSKTYDVVRKKRLGM